MKRWIRTHRTEVWLFVLLWTTYAYFYQSTYHNEAARFDQMRAIAQDHTLEINKYWWNSADVIHYHKNGAEHVYPNKAPGMALVAIVPFGILSLFLNIVRAIGLPEWIYWHALTYLTTICTVSFLSALGAVAIYRTLERTTADTHLSVLAVVGIWLGTLAFPFSTLFFSHQFTAAVLAIAFYLLFKLGREKAMSPGWQFASAGVGGLLMSWSVASEYPTAILAALLSIYALWAINRCKLPARRKVMLVGTLTLGIVIGGVVLLLYNLAAFGKPFYVPYEAYSASGSDFSATYSHGWLGVRWPGLRQFLHAVAAITISPQIGMLYIGVQRWFVYACSPVLWLSLPGLAIMISKREWRAEGLLIAGMTAAYILFITSYGTSTYDWCGAIYLGSRHIIPLLPFLALPLWFGARLLRFVFYPLLAISIFYMLLATAIEPRVPVPYENPARDFLLPDYLRGRFAQNTSFLFGEHRNLTKDSTAFNFGKLAGLPGAYQLTPLMIWWLLAGGALLLRAAKRDDAVEDRQLATDTTSFLKGASPFPKTSLIALLLFVTAISLPPIITHAAALLRHSSHGLLGKYYRNLNWSGPAVDTAVDREINFDWTRTSPLPTPFSVEWVGNIVIDQTEDYTFFLIADDGALLEIDGTVVVDASRVIMQKQSGVIHLNSGLHPIRVRYFNVRWGGSVALSWVGGGQPERIVPTEVLVSPAPSSSPAADR